MTASICSAGLQLRDVMSNFAVVNDAATQADLVRADLVISSVAKDVVDNLKNKLKTIPTESAFYRRKVHFTLKPVSGGPFESE